jgi:site-specific recombinase XerC
MKPLGTITPFTRPNGDKRFRTTWPNHKGGTTRKEHRSEVQAQQALEKWRKDQRKGANLLHSYNHSEQAVVTACMDRAKKGGYDLLDAITHYELHLSTMATNKMDIDSAVNAYVDDRIKIGLEHRSILSIRSTVEPFARDHAGFAVDQVTAATVASWIDQHSHWAPRSVNSHLIRLGAFFRWCSEDERKWTTVVPVTKSMKRKMKKGIPCHFKVDDVRKLLNVAFAKDKEICSLLAVQIFAGLRPAEAQTPGRSGGELLNLHGRTITVFGKIERKRRHITITDNLYAWLTACGDWTGAQINTRKRIAAVLQEAGVENGQDICRHSFASYHLAAFKDAPKTTHEMGHFGNLNMLVDHYRAVVREEDALAFWEIVPPATGEASESPMKRDHGRWTDDQAKVYGKGSAKCGACSEFFKSYSCNCPGECDCPKNLGLCECE